MHQKFLEITSPKFADQAGAELHLEQLSLLDSFAFGYVDGERARTISYHFHPDQLPTPPPVDVKSIVYGIRRECVV